MATRSAEALTCVARARSPPDYATSVPGASALRLHDLIAEQVQVSFWLHDVLITRPTLGSRDGISSSRRRKRPVVSVFSPDANERDAIGGPTPEPEAFEAVSEASP